LSFEGSRPHLDLFIKKKEREKNKELVITLVKTAKIEKIDKIKQTGSLQFTSFNYATLSQFLLTELTFTLIHLVFLLVLSSLLLNYMCLF